MNTWKHHFPEFTSGIIYCSDLIKNACEFWEELFFSLKKSWVWLQLDKPNWWSKISTQNSHAVYACIVMQNEPKWWNLFPEFTLRICLYSNAKLAKIMKNNNDIVVVANWHRRRTRTNRGGIGAGGGANYPKSKNLPTEEEARFQSGEGSDPENHHHAWDEKIKHPG